MNRGQEVKARKVLDNIQPYQPGKPIWEVQKEQKIERVIKLASNENPIGPSPKGIEAILKNLADINRYPDAHAGELKKAIASVLALQTNQLIVTNGADELITLISETFLEQEDEILVPSPSFSEYDFGAHLMGASIVSFPLVDQFEYDVDALLSSVTEQTKILFLCSPNNPTGTYLSRTQLKQILDSLRKDILVVFDGAYSHYATAEDYTNGLEFIALGYPIIVLQTFSKIYGLAGIRVGFGAASSTIIKNILKVKEPFNVNMLAQAAATAAIADHEHVQQSQELNQQGHEFLYKAFLGLGLKYVKSMSNFVLVKIGSNAKEVFEMLMKKGVIIRYGGTWGLPEYVRISVGSMEENEILVNALQEILKVDGE